MLRRAAGPDARVILVAAAVASSWALTARSSAAEPPSSSPAAPSGSAAAREDERAALYKEGIARAEAGRWEEAVVLFRRVIAIRSAPKALFTLGQAEEKLGQLATAERTYKTALADARAAQEHAVIEVSERALRALGPRVPRLVIQLDARSARDQVAATVDGEPVELGMLVAVDPGEHAVVVQAPGAHAFSETVTAGEGQRLVVTALLAPLLPARPSPSPPAASPAPTSTSSRIFVAPIVVGALGIVIGVGGLVVRAVGQSDYDASAGQCPGGACPTAKLRDDGNAARRLIVDGTVVAGVGAAVLAGAGVWWVLSTSTAGSSTAARAGIIFEDRGAIVGARGRF